jgi:two-component system, LytTR family, response regulator
MNIRAAIIEDEQPARLLLRRMLHEESDVEIVGECGNFQEAIVLIRERSPDLLFLDVQMPEMQSTACSDAPSLFAACEGSHDGYTTTS